jgi:hypothetical protein
MLKCPHSLGTLIEWKLRDRTHAKITILIFGPHSLGTLIEWKHGDIESLRRGKYCRPHSLGTLIEWKRLQNSSTDFL